MTVRRVVLSLPYSNGCRLGKSIMRFLCCASDTCSITW